MEHNPIQSIGSSNGEKWLSMAEAALGTPYSAEYLSLLARKNKLSAKKIDNTWFTTRQVVDDYMRRQMIRTQVQNGDLTPVAERNAPAPAAPVLPSVSPSAAGAPALKTIRTYKDDHLEYEAKIKKENPHIEVERALEKVIEKKLIKPQTSAMHRTSLPEIGRNLKGLSKSLAGTAVIATISLTILPIPFVFGFLEQGIDKVIDAVSDARTVMGFRPGTHENELLLLDKEGNISIMGHVETDGQLRSHVGNGVAPIVVDSTTQVANLNADLLDNMQAEEFTLAYVTKNGAVTTENVQLYGNVEVGKTLLVKGATKLLAELEVGGDLKVFGDAEFKQAMRVLGPSEFEGVVEMMNNLSVKKNINVRGSIVAGSSVQGKSASFNKASVSEFFANTIEAVEGTIDDLISNSIVVDGLTAATSSTITASTTNLTSASSTLTRLTFDIATGTSATTTNFYSSSLVAGQATTTNFYSSIGNFQTLGVAGNLTVSGDTTTIGQLLSTRVPTLPHMFTTWPAGTSNASDATIYINPATAAADTNIFAAAVGGAVKFLVDAEGDMYANNLVLAGSTSLGETTVAGNLVVQDSATLGDASSDLVILNGQLLALASTTLQNFTFVNATGTSATTTNLFSTTASSTNLYATSLWAGGGTLGGLTMTGNVLASTGGINIGSSGTRFGTIYADTVDATSLTGTVVSGSTSANDWLINSDNATADTENMTLGFERGSLVPNALLTWNASSDRFEFNSDLYVGSGIGNGTLLVNGSTTLQNFTFQNATGTSATTTNLSTTNFTSGNILPLTDNTYDLGSSALRWKTLHVGPGSVVVHNDATNTLKATLGFSGSTAQLVTDAATPLQVTTGANTGLNINTSGNVGVGDASPTNRLDVAGAIGISDTTVIDASRNLTNIGTVSAGNVTAGTYNSQTISSAANFTGTLSTAGSIFSGDEFRFTSESRIISTADGAISLTNNAGNANATLAVGTVNGQTISSAANFTGTMAIGGAVTLAQNTSIGTSGMSNLIRDSYWGYSTSYRTAQVGIPTQTVSLGVDLTGNTSGAFSGNGGEVVFKNAVNLMMPNAANNSYVTFLDVDASGNLATAGTINGQTISSSANFTGTLNVTGATTLNGVINIPSTSYFKGNATYGYRFNNAADSLNLMIITDAGAVSIPNGTLAVASTITEAGSAVLSAADVDTCAEVASLVVETGSCGSVVMSASPTLTGTTRFDFGSGYTAINTGFASSHGYSTGNWGVRLGATGSAGVIQAAQDSTAYPLSLNPYGGAVTIGGNTAWHAGNDGAGSTLDADTLDSYSSLVFGNWGNKYTHGACTTGFDCADNEFGATFVQGSGQGPGISGATQYYQQYYSLGSDYGPDLYGMQVGIPRTSQGGTPYMSVRYKENGTYGSWSKIYAGYADTAGALTSMNISQFTNNSGYITDGNTNWDNSYGFITDGNTNWDNSYGFVTSGSDPTFGSVSLTSALRNNGSVADDDGFGVCFDSSCTDSYRIYREAGAWSGTYPDLRIAFHTGIKLGAHSSYNGMRFYNNSDMATLVMAVNDASTSGENNVYMAGELLLAGTELQGDGKTMLRYSDGYLRLNEDVEFGSGIWMSSSNLLGSSGYWALGSNGGTTNSNIYLYGGGYDGTNNIRIDGTTGYYHSSAGTATDRWGNVNTSGWGVDALSTGNWDLLVYETGQLYFANTYMGYGGTAAIYTYDTNENLILDPNGSGYVDLESPATNIGYWLDGKAALTGESTDNWLRLNQNSSFSNGVYTPGHFRADGGITSGGLSGLGAGTVHASGEVRAPILYDYNNTGYYADPNGTSVMHRIFMTDRASDWGATGEIQANYLVANNGIYSYNGICSGNASGNCNDAGQVWGTADFRGTQFVDHDNTGYYLDPNNTSVLSSILTTTVDTNNLFVNGYGGVTGSGCDLADFQGGIMVQCYGFSDQELKSNVVDLASSGSMMEKIKQINGVSYEFNETFYANNPQARQLGEQIGFIAQDVQEFFPQVIGTTTEGYLTLTYSRLLPVVWEGLKEVYDRVLAIEARLTAVEYYASSTPSQVSTTTPGFVASVLESIIATVENGVTKFVSLVVDNLSTYALTVGKSDAPAGITIYDEDTGEPYCMKVKSGQQIATAGVCGIQVAQAPESGGGGTTFTPIEIIEPNATSTEPVASSTPVTTEPEPTSTSTPTSSDDSAGQAEPVVEPAPTPEATEPPADDIIASTETGNGTE